jgi:hypothetical protein
MKRKEEGTGSSSRRIFFVLRPSSFILLFIAGCAAPPGTPKIDPIYAPPETATIDFWMDRPATVVVNDVEYDRLWRACERVAADRSYALERRDYRNGVLTTRPVLGGQFFEVGRHTVADSYGFAESNLGTVRKTVQFQILTLDDGTFEARPKVVVERRVVLERRVSIGLQNRNAFGGAAVVGTNDYDPTVPFSAEYWYASRRDEALEGQLAGELKKLLK